MEQLFGMVNSLLASNEATRQRDLCIRTYKVVPLSPSAGILEWVDQTQPLSQYLIADRSYLPAAHSRYRPKDWTTKQVLHEVSHGRWFDSSCL